MAECDRLGALEGSEINAAKIILANEVTTLCHGADAAAAAEATAREVFEKGWRRRRSADAKRCPPPIWATGCPWRSFFVRAGLAASGKEAKRLIAEGGAKANDAAVSDAGQMVDAEALAAPMKLSAGKKRHALVVLD